MSDSFEPWEDWEFAWESWNTRRLADAERLGLPASASRADIEAEELRREGVYPAANGQAFSQARPLSIEEVNRMAPTEEVRARPGRP